MRRIICCFVLLLCCGCSASASGMKPVVRSVEFLAKAEYYDNDCEFLVSINENGCMNAAFSKPDCVSGLEFTVNEHDTVISCGGITYSADTSSQPFCGLVAVLYGVFNDAGNSRLTSKNGTYLCSGNTGRGYNLTVADTGLPISLVADGGRLKADFFDISIT